MGAYSASKAGVIMLTKLMAYEWAPCGMRANAVCPGTILAPLTESLYRDPEASAAREAGVPCGRVNLPEDVASATAFLASDEASYVTGQALIRPGPVRTAGSRRTVTSP